MYYVYLLRIPALTDVANSTRGWYIFRHSMVSTVYICRNPLKLVLAIGIIFAYCQKYIDYSFETNQTIVATYSEGKNLR
jgi:hypothetical protein